MIVTFKFRLVQIQIKKREEESLRNQTQGPEISEAHMQQVIRRLNPSIDSTSALPNMQIALNCQK